MPPATSTEQIKEYYTNLSHWYSSSPYRKIYMFHCGDCFHFLLNWYCGWFCYKTQIVKKLVNRKEHKTGEDM